HPAGFRPLWPVDSFHSYPVGQPALTALLHDLGGLDWREAGLAGHALAYALAIIGFAAAASRWSRGSALGLAVGAAAVLAARAPLLLLCGPYLASLHLAMPASGVEWVRAFLRESATLNVFPRMLHDVPLVAGAAGFLSVLGSRPRRAVLPIALSAALALLVLNG